MEDNYEELITQISSIFTESDEETETKIDLYEQYNSLLLNVQNNTNIQMPEGIFYSYVNWTLYYLPESIEDLEDKVIKAQQFVVFYTRKHNCMTRLINIKEGLTNLLRTSTATLEDHNVLKLRAKIGHYNDKINSIRRITLQ